MGLHGVLLEMRNSSCKIFPLEPPILEMLRTIRSLPDKPHPRDPGRTRINNQWTTSGTTLEPWPQFREDRQWLVWIPTALLRLQFLRLRNCLLWE